MACRRISLELLRAVTLLHVAEAGSAALRGTYV